MRVVNARDKLEIHLEFSRFVLPLFSVRNPIVHCAFTTTFDEHIAFKLEFSFGLGVGRGHESGRLKQTHGVFVDGPEITITQYHNVFLTQQLLGFFACEYVAHDDDDDGGDDMMVSIMMTMSTIMMMI